MGRRGGDVRNTFLYISFLRKWMWGEKASDAFDSSECPIKHHFASAVKQKSFQPNSKVSKRQQ